jgi:hypothetical protein
MSLVCVCEKCAVVGTLENEVKVIVFFLHKACAAASEICERTARPRPSSQNDIQPDFLINFNRTSCRGRQRGLTPAAAARALVVPDSSSDLDHLLGHEFLQHTSMTFRVGMFFGIIVFHFTHCAVPALDHLLDSFFPPCRLMLAPVVLPPILSFIRAGRRNCPVRCCGGAARACILARCEIIVAITLGKVPPFRNAGPCLAVFCVDSSHAHQMAWTLWRRCCHRKRVEEHAWGGERASE